MTVLVTGARGAIARAVADRLAATGHHVRAGSRDAMQARPIAGVDPVTVDASRPETLAPALDGVRAVFLYAIDEGVTDFLDTAKNAGVERIVLLSALAVTSTDPTQKVLADRHLLVEEPIRESGIAWTFLRPGAFAGNALAWAPSIRAEGGVAMPYPDSYSTPIHERDIAEVAVAALTTPGHEGAAYSLAGPESMTRARQVELIGDALGRELTVTGLAPEQVRDIPPFLLEMLARNREEPTDGGPTIADVLGSPARTFASWAREHAGDFR